MYLKKKRKKWDQFWSNYYSLQHFQLLIINAGKWKFLPCYRYLWFIWYQSTNILKKENLWGTHSYRNLWICPRNFRILTKKIVCLNTSDRFMNWNMDPFIIDFFYFKLSKTKLNWNSRQFISMYLITVIMV